MDLSSTFEFLAGWIPRPWRPAVAFFARFLTAAGALAGAVLAYVSVGQAFDADFVLPETLSTRVALVVSIGALAFGATCLWQLISASRKNEGDKSQLLDAIADELRDASRRRHWDVVLRFGRVMLRPLWIAGRYDTLTQLGQMMEEAAVHAKSPIDQATALIDALGWTMHKAGRSNEAIKNITHGIEIAQKVSAHELLYKAYRHLAGIALERPDPIEAKKMLELAKAEMELIEPPAARQTCDAGLDLAFGLVLQKEGNNAEALIRFGEAREKYQKSGDHERLAKMFQYIANTYRRMDNTPAALDCFREGLEAAEQIQRKDAIAENAMGAAELYEVTGQKTRASELLIVAADAFQALGQSVKATDLRRKSALLVAQNGKHA